jgi:hypothetical protein
VATYEVISWRDIPAVVEARDDQGACARQLSERWQALIDSVAMLLGRAGTEEYLAEWTRSAPAERPGRAAEVAEAVAQELEERFPEFAARAFRRA